MKLRDSSILFSHPNIYVDKVIANTHDDILFSKVFLLYTPDHGIMVCDNTTIEIIKKCNGNNNFLDIANGIDASISEIKATVEYLVGKGIISVDEPIIPCLLNSDTTKENMGTYGFWIHITNDCNLRCKYCYIDKDKTVMQSSTLDTIINSIINSSNRHDAKKLFFKISGGEPLTNFSVVKHLVDYVNKKCKEHGGLPVHFELLTNGTIISEEIISFIKTNNISVSISLDTDNESTEESRVFTNGNGSAELVKSNIEIYMHNGIYPRIMVTVNKNNLYQLPSLTEYLIEKRLRFRFSLEKDCTVFIPNIMSYSSELKTILNECFNIMGTALLNHKFDWQFKFNNIKFGIPRNRSCAAGMYFFAVGANGEFSSCGLGLSQNTYKIAPEEDLINTLQNYYQDFSSNNSLCQNCRWFACCANDCPIQSKANLVNNAVSPFCSVLQFVIPHLLRLDALRIYMCIMARNEDL